ncbi:MAG: hypothetical protein KUG77_04185 [Nannocystaceae bacterium]|nr:hypothetical protein [Nannocystaceae bacterium]
MIDASPRMQKAASMRRSTLVLAASLLTACFSPKVDPNTNAEGSGGETGTDAVGSSGGGLETSSTDQDTETSGDPDSTAGETQGSTIDPNDTAPTLESFTVNGSTEPDEVDEGGSITLEAEANDDLGVVGVEFFDGEASLGVDDDAPYELEVGVSSADSGSHTYRAVATDTVGQTGESEDVVLSVNIVGGEVLFYRGQLFNGRSGLGGPELAVATTATGRVFVNGSLAGTATGRVLSFNDDLSSLWTDNDSGLTRAPIVDLGDELLTSTWEDGTWTYRLRAQESPAVVDSLNIAVPAGDLIVTLLGSRATSGGAGVVITTLPSELASYSTALAGPDWTHELPSTAIISDLDPMSDGAVLVTFATETACSPGAMTCLRRLESDGSTAWTAGVATGSTAAARPNQSVVALATRPDGGLNYAEISAEGRVAPEQVLDTRQDFSAVPDVSDDGLGGFVFVATVDGNSGRTAVVQRYDENSDLVWEQDEIAEASDSMGLGISVLNNAVFVCGIEDLETAGLSTTGDVFAAKLRL